MYNRIISLNYTPCIPYLTKNVSSPFLLLLALTMCGLPCPFPKTFGKNSVDGEKIPLSRRKNACLPHQKKSFSPNSNFHVITQYKVHLQLQSLLLYHFFNFRFYVQIYQANFDYSMVTESYLQHDKSIGWSKFLQTKFPTSSPLFYLSMLFGKPCLNYCLFSSLLHPFLISNFCFHSSWDWIAYELITLHKK